MLLREHPDGHVTFHWYWVSDSIIAISYMAVHGPRRQGTGSEFYRAWEFNLPKKVTEIQLRAKDSEAASFWSAMGFKDDLPPDEGGARCMSKIITY